MATLAGLISRVRMELGDFGQPFRDVFAGTGEVGEYDFTETRVTNVSITAVSTAGAVDLVPVTDFDVDTVDGRLLLKGAYNPLPVGTTLLANGTTAGMFTDEEIQHYVDDAWLQHSHGRKVTGRYRDGNGFIRYIDDPMTLETLPPIEDLLVSWLATIEALWALTTDAATDIDISTSDGTHLPRSQRYVQMRNQIDVLTEKYADLCSQLNVGLHRIEMSTLRRVSRTTGRLVPTFESREYDDYTLPKRLLPPIDGAHEDESGIASPAFSGFW